LAQAVAQWRQQGLSIATLNGSFDLLHAGHLYIIFEASRQADILLMALNTDHSIQQYKGPSRPIVPLEYRLQLVAALEWVSAVTWFDETDPRALLTVVRPDVHVNGAEYGTDCIEAETVRAHGGRLHLVNRIPSLATTDLVATIKRCV
jgi:D-glycero-beta-D-manno-heptose 1-phosphate adenylyltransferase